MVSEHMHKCEYLSADLISHILSSLRFIKGDPLRQLTFFRCVDIGLCFSMLAWKRVLKVGLVTLVFMLGREQCHRLAESSKLETTE